MYFVLLLLLLVCTILLIIVLFRKKELFGNNLTKRDFKLIYLNLEKDISKRNKFMSNCQKINLNVHRFNAVNGNLLSSQTKRNLVTQNYITDSFLNHKTSGQLGCAMSHFKILEENNNLGKHLIVFEDDAILNSNFNNNLSIFLKALPNNWDMFYLYINNFYLNPVQRKKGSKQRVRINEQLYKPIAPHGTICYGINKNSISKVLSLLKPLDNTPIDNQLASLIDEGKINCYTPPRNIVGHPNIYYSSTFQKFMTRKTVD